MSRMPRVELSYSHGVLPGPSLVVSAIYILTIVQKPSAALGSIVVYSKNRGRNG